MELVRTTLVYLVRHGATDANARRPYILQGHGIDLALNDGGRRQARCAGRLLASEPVRAVFASPMRRALETAQVIAEPHKLAVATIDTFIECNVGRWEGRDWETIRREFPREYEDFHRDPSLHPYLGGESYSDVHRRTAPVFRSLLETHAGSALVLVAHNIVNRVLIADVLGLELKRAKEIQQANGGVTLIRHQDGRADLVTLNSLFHLDADLR
jgi:broad specificity phosphatase PhoE